MKKLQIFGTGCAKCERLAEAAAAAADQLGIPCELEKVQDLNQIMEFGVMATPALAIDGEVKVAGKVPSVEDIRGMLDETT